jgi:hypothetical protein
MFIKEWIDIGNEVRIFGGKGIPLDCINNCYQFSISVHFGSHIIQVFEFARFATFVKNI